MDKLLDVQNLRVSFHTYAGEVRAVRGVSFHLNEGETLAFVGESGCGKTVTAKAVMRLLFPPQAEIKEDSVIRFRDKDVIAMGKDDLRNYRGNDVSMIFQDPMTSLNPTMTVGKQIMESLMLHRGLDKKAAHEEAIHMLETVRIPDAKVRVDEYPHQMSGGMRQRVMIAMALSCNPDLLIADEPTTALDVTTQAQIMELLADLQKKSGASIILVTHDLGVVAKYADRIQVMYAGQIVESGTAREVFYDAKHPYTWALLSSVPGLDTEGKKDLYALKGTPPDLIVPISHCPFADRCEYCMEICREAAPEETYVSEGHRVSCWLCHPSAPKVKSYYERRHEGDHE